MAAMEMRRPSAGTAEAPPAAGLDDRLNRLLEGTTDDLPPLDAPAQATRASAVLHQPVQELIQHYEVHNATAPPAPADVTETPAPTPATASAVAPAPAEIAPAPVGIAAAEEKPAPAPAAPAVPVQLVPRPITNLTPGEKRDASLQAELYSIIVTMDHLESAFVKNVVDAEEYQKHCNQIVNQFKTLREALRDKVPDVKVWLKEQDMSFPLAENRLLDKGGVDAKTLHGKTASGSSGKEALAIHAATEHFITLTNALQINYSSVLELLPIVQELQTSIVAIPNLPQLAGMERITNWLVTLSNMEAANTLSENQVKQLTLDADLAYTSFRNWLQDRR